MSDPYLIYAPAEPQFQRSVPLLSLLEYFLPVKFSFSQKDQSQARGEILRTNASRLAECKPTDLSSLGIAQAEPAPSGGELVEITIRFSDDLVVPFPFRGRSLQTKISAKPTVLSLSHDEKPLAVCDLGPVWAFSLRKAAKHFRSGFALPALPVGGSLLDVLSGHRFLEMLPLLHWVREICADTSVIDPPLRACFIFDDPNLHWPSYGFVDYRELAAQAEKQNFHVSFATIPLDTWFTHSETAGIFRKYRNRLSLLVHGNNHSKRELAQQYTKPERKFLLKQALERIEHLERRTNLSVSRVMVPPHGACSEEMLAELPVCGFEAACISHGSLRAHNKASAWTKILGYRPFEVVRGCPVLPRWGLSNNVENSVLLAAYLKQAIILRGHHQDLKNGPDLLEELSQLVNGLGSVAWLNMTEMARSSYDDSLFETPQTLRAESSIASLEAAAGIEKRSLPGASFSFIRRLLTEGRDRLLQ